MKSSHYSCETRDHSGQHHEEGLEERQRERERESRDGRITSRAAHDILTVHSYNIEAYKTPFNQNTYHTYYTHTHITHTTLCTCIHVYACSTPTYPSTHTPPTHPHTHQHTPTHPTHTHPHTHLSYVPLPFHPISLRPGLHRAH